MGLTSTGNISPVSSLLGLGGAFQKGLVFLLNLAWNSRFRLPVLITVGFMVLDVRMQLEINVDVEVRHVHLPDEEDDDDDDDEDVEDEDDDSNEDIEDDEDDDSSVSHNSYHSGIESEEGEVKLKEEETVQSSYTG